MRSYSTFLRNEELKFDIRSLLVLAREPYFRVYYLTITTDLQYKGAPLPGNAMCVFDISILISCS